MAAAVYKTCVLKGASVFLASVYTIVLLLLLLIVLHTSALARDPWTLEFRIESTASGSRKANSSGILNWPACLLNLRMCLCACASALGIELELYIFGNTCWLCVFISFENMHRKLSSPLPSPPLGSKMAADSFQCCCCSLSTYAEKVFGFCINGPIEHKCHFLWCLYKSFDLFDQSEEHHLETCMSGSSQSEWAETPMALWPDADWEKHLLWWLSVLCISCMTKSV